MPKMVTVERRAVGSFNWEPDEQARIERNVFVRDGEIWEALRFCKNKNGRHNRVHLVITERDFVELFRSAVQNGVFHQDTIEQMRNVLGARGDPFQDVIGLGADGTLATNIDSELYGE